MLGSSFLTSVLKALSLASMIEDLREILFP